MKQTPLERQLVLDIQLVRVGGHLTEAALWRWEHVRALARARAEEEARKRRRAKQTLLSIPALWAGVRL